MTELHITLGMTREQFAKDERLCAAVDAAVAALDADPTRENKVKLNDAVRRYNAFLRELFAG